MTTRFAGSRHLDERRRRRLATSAGEQNESDGVVPSSTVSARTRVSAKTTASPFVSHFPIHKLISPKLWKLWGIGMLGLFAGIGIIAAGSQVATGNGSLGPGFARLFDLSTGRVAAQFNSLLLLLSSQLALLIWWARSRSLEDFAGRYRHWTWCAGVGLIAALVSATGLHVAWGETAAWLWKSDIENRALLCWLLPAAICAAAVFWTLNREMCGCRSSSALLWLAVGGWLVAGLAALEIRLPIPRIREELVQAGSPMFASLCLWMSMLLHVRYVVYETPEPPEIRPMRLKFRLPRFRWPTSRLRLVREETPTTDNEHKQAGRNQTNAKTVSVSKRTMPNHTAELTEDTKTAQQPKTLDDKTQQPETNDAVEQSAVPKMRTDGPVDQESLKGLSKCERRRLRKQRREEQRSAQH